MAGLGKWGAALLGLPEEYGCEGSGVAFEEGRAVTVCPCRALLSYTENEVGLETVRGLLTVVGQGLTLKSFHGDVMEIRGRVTDIRYREKTETKTEKGDWRK